MGIIDIDYGCRSEQVSPETIQIPNFLLVSKIIFETIFGMEFPGWNFRDRIFGIEFSGLHCRDGIFEIDNGSQQITELIYFDLG